MRGWAIIYSNPNKAALKDALTLFERALALDSQNVAQWEQAIDWCEKAAGSNPQFGGPLAYLAAANAWAGHAKDAREAASQLQKVSPGFTVQKSAGSHWSDDPTFNAQQQRITEGLRKAGLPEGDKSTN
jgi:hypothetical protein